MLPRFLVHVLAYVGDRVVPIRFVLNAPSARLALADAERQAEQAGYDSPTADRVVPLGYTRP